MRNSSYISTEGGCAGGFPGFADRTRLRFGRSLKRRRMEKATIHTSTISGLGGFQPCRGQVYIKCRCSHNFSFGSPSLPVYRLLLHEFVDIVCCCYINCRTSRIFFNIPNEISFTLWSPPPRFQTAAESTHPLYHDLNTSQPPASHQHGQRENGRSSR